MVFRGNGHNATLARFTFPFLNVVYDSGKGKAVGQITHPWLLRLEIAEELTNRQHQGNLVGNRAIS